MKMLPIRVPKAAIRAPTDRAVIWQIQGKREVVRPGFSLHFWHVKKFESRYPMKWMDFFMAQLPMKNFWAIGKRRKCKDFVTETPSLTIAPHHWSQLHLQEPPAAYQNWYINFISISGCLYLLHDVVTIGFHCFSVPATWKTCIFCPHKTPPTAFQGATLLRLLNSTSGFPFRSLSMLHRSSRRRSRVKARFCWTSWTYARYLKWSKLWDLRIQNDNYRIAFNGH